jgi:hypothetical protein
MDRILYYQLQICPCNSGIFLRHEKEAEPELILETECDEKIPSDSDGRHDEYYATAACDNNASGAQDHTWNSCGVHPSTGCPCGMRM